MHISFNTLSQIFWNLKVIYKPRWFANNSNQELINPWKFPRKKQIQNGLLLVSQYYWFFFSFFSFSSLEITSRKKIFCCLYLCYYFRKNWSILEFSLKMFNFWNLYNYFSKGNKLWYYSMWYFSSNLISII